MEARYERQINLKKFGKEGQRNLENSSVLVIGAGGTGSLLIQYLARMGLGHIKIVEPDTVSLSNLHRQILYTESDLGRKKAEVMKDSLSKINTNTNLEIVDEFLSETNFAKLASPVDLVIDAVDVLSTKLLINKLSMQNGKASIFSSVSNYTGQVFFSDPKGKPCLNCFMSAQDEIASRVLNAVFPPAVGLASSLMTSIAVQYLANNKLDYNFYLIDGKQGKIKNSRITANKECPYCS